MHMKIENILFGGVNVIDIAFHHILNAVDIPLGRLLLWIIKLSNILNKHTHIYKHIYAYT